MLGKVLVRRVCVGGGLVMEGVRRIAAGWLLEVVENACDGARWRVTVDAPRGEEWDA